MKIHVYPADRYGCGHHRLIWPAELLRAQGYDVEVFLPGGRNLTLTLDGDAVTDVDVPSDVDVVVMQRVTHRYLVQVVPLLRARGVAVVIDVDDDLSVIDPRNPAWTALHPDANRKIGTSRDHSWRNLAAACRAATLVTVTTDPLTRVYGGHGRVRVLRNYLADHYYAVPATAPINGTIGWPATLRTHPGDTDVVGHALAQLNGATLVAFDPPDVAARAFNLPAHHVTSRGDVALTDWPTALAELAVGITPLAATRFNRAKSWLKPLELAAVGVPWVGSPAPEYQRLHDLGCGQLAARPRDWLRALSHLLADELQRRQLADAGRDVARELMLRSHVWRWAEAWSDALELQRNGTSRPRAPTARVIGG